MDSAICGEKMRCGFSRCGVYRSDFETTENTFRGLTPNSDSIQVTRRQLQLDSPDSVTGWFAERYVEETIEMIIQVEGSRRLNLPGGTWVELDALGLTADVVVEGDEIKLKQDNVYYKVERVEPIYAPADNFHHRKCHLSLMKVHE